MAAAGVSEDPFAPAEAAGIHRLAIPTPFAVGRVNCYLIEDEPLTLLDAGPNSGRSLDELQRQLAALGHRIEDLDLILISHQHIDHIGLVEIVANHAGAEVAAIDRLVPFVENYSEAATAADEFGHATMLRHGIPDDVATAVHSVSEAFRAWGARASVTRVLRDGDTVEFRDRRLEVHFRPGHSPTDTVLYDPDRRLLLAADHLIKHISSNPLIARPFEGGDRYQSLVVYMQSLAATREMDIALTLPGHGDPVDDHRALIDQRFALHERRAEKIFEMIEQRPRSAYDVALSLWGNVAVTQAYLTLSEVLGHTDLLLNAGRVVEVEENGRVLFEAV
jgi:glyoxylase-like metal-dependent hydrolase (beta-lactamase superfamily II)